MLHAFAVAALLAVTPVSQAAAEPSLVDRLRKIADIVLDDERPYYIQLGGLTTGAGLSVGPGVRLRGLAGGRLNVDAVGMVSNRRYLLAEGAVTAAMPGVSGLRAGLFGRRRYFPQEDFFGIGSDAAESDRVNFTYDENAAGGLLTYAPGSPLKLEGRIEYREPEIGEGHSGSVPSIETRFAPGTVPGLSRQPAFLVGTATVTWEGATPVGRPRQGGRYEVSVSRYQGRGTSGSDFDRLDVDLRQYVPVAPDRHILAVRAVLSTTGAADRAQVPFYYMPRLGGSSSLRAYPHFRFYDRNLVLLQGEYRWLPVRFVETVVFYDAGTVAPRLSDLARDGLLSDYGIGVRFGTDWRVLFRVEAAFGGIDGPRVFAKFSGGF